MRKLGYVQSAIWTDNTFRRISAPAQHAYLMLLSQPDVSSCGTIAYTPKRWATFTSGQNSKTVHKAVRELADHRFVVVDEDTEELLIRTFFKHNKVATQPKMLLNATDVYSSIASATIRQVLWEENPTVFAQPSHTETPTERGIETPTDSLSGAYPVRARPEDLDKDNLQGQGPVAPKPRNEIWDALESTFGYTPKESQRSLWGKLCRELSECDATGPRVTEAARRYKLDMPHATLTPTGLANHYQRLMSPSWTTHTNGGMDAAALIAIARSEDEPETNRDVPRIGPSRLPPQQDIA